MESGPVCSVVLMTVAFRIFMMIGKLNLRFLDWFRYLAIALPGSGGLIVSAMQVRCRCRPAPDAPSFFPWLRRL